MSLNNELTTVEKVIFLQEVDIFRYTSSEDLAQIAAISEEVSFPKETIIQREGEIPQSMYLVIGGKVRFMQGTREIMTATSKQAFGTWALFDEQPALATATCLDETHVLELNKDDFFDLLSDNVSITQGILKHMATHLRGLIKRVPVTRE